MMTTTIFSLEPDGTLRTAAAFDYETHSDSYSVRVRVTDELNASFEKAFSVAFMTPTRIRTKTVCLSILIPTTMGTVTPMPKKSPQTATPQRMVLALRDQVIYVDEDAEGENNGSSGPMPMTICRPPSRRQTGSTGPKFGSPRGVYRPDVGPGRTAGTEPLLSTQEPARNHRRVSGA